MFYYKRKNTEPIEIMRARVMQDEEIWEEITEEEYNNLTNN